MRNVLVRPKSLGAAVILASAAVAFLLPATPSPAQPRPEKSKFSAMATDAQGVETELRHMIFYWEEKISETSFVPHELTHLPVKKGTATVNVKFETIKQVDVKPAADKAPPAVTITLQNGKSGEFALAVNGSFKGETDFGDLEVPAQGLKKVVFK